MSEHQDQSKAQLVTQHQIEEEKEITSSVNVYVWGSAECDQFDLRDQDGEEQPECKRPYKLEIFNLQGINIISIACGGLHTLLLSDLGQVYGCGCNDVFVLGKRDKEISDRIPCHIPLPVGVDMISAGDSHSTAANSAASIVYCWGVYKNTNGNMESPHEKPTRIGDKVFNKPIVKLLSGYNHTLVLMDKKIYCWGDQDTKVLGRKSNTRHNISQCLNPEALGIRSVVDVYTGGYHSFVKVEKKDNKFAYYAWGLNNYGQLGIGCTQDVLVPTEIVEFRNKHIKNIVGGEHHTIALLEGGEVYTFGRNDDGQIGQGEALNETLKQQAQQERLDRIQFLKEQNTQLHTLKLKQKAQKELDGLLSFDRVIGYEFVTRPMLVADLPKMDHISAAGHFSYAYNLVEQKFFSWGMGNSYVLGTREEDTVYAPFQIPQSFFKNEKVLQIALGGQHVTVLTSSDPKVVLGGVRLESLKVQEKDKISKLKAFRQPVTQPNGRVDVPLVQSNIKSKTPLSKSKPNPTELDEPVRKLKLD